MIVAWHEQNEADVPPDDGWLGPRELERLAEMRFAKRRADWRLGRWTAKHAVSAFLGLPRTLETLWGLEIRAAPSGAPEVFCAGEAAAVTISLSHRSGVAVCAATAKGGMLGCDIERIEPRSELFVADYFTPEEQRLIEEAPRGAPWLLPAVLWSAKESLLKALRIGLRADTRSLNVSLEPRLAAGGGWQPLCVHHAACGTLHGWWCAGDGFVRTLVAAVAGP